MTDPAPAPDSARIEGARVLEWAGWAALAGLTLVIALLAILRPTSPAHLLNEIRLAAGVDRYQAAMNEGDRLYSTARAELRIAEKEPEARQPMYRMLAAAAGHFQRARRETGDYYKARRAQDALADVHFLWARSLHEDGTGPWYRPNHRPTLRRAREIVDEALALPDLTGDRREQLEELGKRIDRAITPWPIL